MTNDGAEDTLTQYCSGCGAPIMKYFVEVDIYDLDKKKGCKKINVELKCKSRGCNTFNNFLIVA